MAERRHVRRLRTALAWLLTAGVVAYAVVDLDAGERRNEPLPALDDGSAPEKLRIESISEAELAPGDALIVHVSGADEAQPVEARIAKQPARVLSRRGDTVVVEVPTDLAEGRASLRLFQGERKSKPFDLLIERVKRGRLFASLLGGLALFVYGLGSLSRGLRGLAGQRVRRWIARITRGRVRSLGAGVVVGGVTQLTTTTAGFVVGLLQSRLLAVDAAIAVLVGAQLGAVAIGALLPFSVGRDALLIVVVGVIWIRLAINRRGESIGQLIFGAGLLFYGLYLLQTGFQPLVGDPSLLAYVRTLSESGVVGVLVCAATGAALAAVLQGPGPVFGLVLGLAQSTGALGVDRALAILAGASVGAAADIALVAWPAGRTARRVALAHLAYGALAMLVTVVSVPVWTALAAGLVPGDAAELAYGKKVLLPNVGAHLAVAFVASQLAFAVVWLGALPVVTRWAMREATRRAPTPQQGEPVVPLKWRLLAAFRHQRRSVGSVLELALTGDRDRAVAAEHALQDARTDVEDVFALLITAAEGDHADDPLRRTVVATLQTQRSIEHLLRVAELGVERNLTLGGEDQQVLRGIHGYVLDGIDAILQSIESGAPPDLEAARAREIHLNAREQDARKQLVHTRRAAESASVRLGLTELLGAYENVGNHLYRVCESLAEDAGDDLD